MFDWFFSAIQRFFDELQRLLDWIGILLPNPSLGFDRNEYPGDAAMTELRKRFVFCGYWLNKPQDAPMNDQSPPVISGPGWSHFQRRQRCPVSAGFRPDHRRFDLA